MQEAVSDVLQKELVGLDSDILSYLISIIENMSMTERRTAANLSEVIEPFLIDTNYCDEINAANKCKNIAVAFGGSGFSKQIHIEEEDQPVLLAAPMKMIDYSSLNKSKSTYGHPIMAENNENTGLVGNSNLEISSVPVTQKQVRKQRKENEQLNKLLRQEALQREKEEEELRLARMAAIKASRLAGRQANAGVNIERFSLAHPSGTGDLLTDASLTLARLRRYGLIGRNGAGKTTLLKAVANYRLPNLLHLKIILVDQHVEGDSSSAIDWLLRADVERTSLLEDEARLLTYIQNHDPSTLPEDLRGVNLDVALAECTDRLEAIGAHTAEFRAKKILTGLGFTASTMSAATESLSGGWAMRAALASALFTKPDLLLLDEPTNHLDLHALVWLEKWLVTDFEGIALIVSHDTCFLDEVCTDILEFRSTLANQSVSSLTHYNGDFSTYENTLREKKIAQARMRDAYETQREKLKEFISREGKKYDNPAHQAQRKMKMKQLEQLEAVEKVEEESELVLTFPTPYSYFENSDKMVSIQNASFGWTSGELLFKDVDFCISPRSRIIVLGKNGCGKTCLLNLLIGALTPIVGTVTRHVGSRITMLQQHHYKGEQLDPSLSALEHIRRLPHDDTTAVGFFDPGTRQEETAQRSYLSNFGVIGPRALIPVKYLSGGQRMRVALAVALFRRPDVLILDEPTNHLDSDTEKALCGALSNYDGAVIAVSHDEAFVNRLMSSKTDDHDDDKLAVRSPGDIWVLSKQRVTRFEGSFKDYKGLILRKIMSGGADE